MTDGQQMSDSQRLFAEYARNGSDAAFRELAARYLDLVYSTALRLVEGDTHRAEDVSQTVFADLARMASKLSPEVMLGGWLHRHTCFIAANTLRGERRRQCRERQAVEMNALQPDPDPNLKLLAPILDEAINELGEADRTAILLRFFEQRDFRAVGESLGSTEDAARMRVTRALEKLQLLLKRRGVTTTAAALSVLLAASAVQAAPAGLAVTVSTAAALGGTTLAASTTATATKAIAMTTLQKAVIGATLAAAVGAGVYKTVEAWTSQNPAQTAQHLKLDRTYALGEKTEFVLRLHESARLKFLDNAAGISDFLFQYDRDGLGFSYGFEGQKNRDSSTLTAEHTNDSRIISKSGGPVLMDCTTGWRREGAKARITFIARLVTDKEFKEETARREQQQLESLRRVLEWEDNQAVAPARMIIPTLDNPNLIALRTDYGLDKVVAGAADDYEQLRRLVKWVHDRWQHSGNNTPSKSDPRTILAEAAEGRQFRCVEYAIVVAGCAQALGMPARVLGLKREDAETARSDAGHVVSEVWLNSRKKWVFVDGQWDAIPEKNGVPLNAIEFQDAFAHNAVGLTIRSSSNIDVRHYFPWVVPYLYYFDFNLSQELFGTGSDHAEKQRYDPVRGKIMLVPKGAKKTTVFQRTTPIKNCTYISSPSAFYAAPPGDASQ